AVTEHLDGVDGGALARGDEIRGAAVVELPLPEVVRGGVDVGDGVAMEDHADELGGPAALENALVAVVVAALAGADHEAHGLHGSLRGDLRAPGASAGDGDAVLHEARSGRALFRRDEIDGAELVVRAPASPVGQGTDVLAHLRFGGRGGHEGGYLS